MSRLDLESAFSGQFRILKKPKRRPRSFDGLFIGKMPYDRYLYWCARDVPGFKIKLVEGVGNGG